MSHFFLLQHNKLPTHSLSVSVHASKFNLSRFCRLTKRCKLCQNFWIVMVESFALKKRKETSIWQKNQYRKQVLTRVVAMVGQRILLVGAEIDSI